MIFGLGTLDRMLLYAFFRSYLIVWTSILSLYIIIDLFMNIDDFTSRGGGLLAVVKHITSYYLYRITQIFGMLAEIITLLGAMFTVSWMQRNNELLPQLSAGIPTRRVLRPVLLGSALTLALGPINQELIIPRIANELMTPRNDPEMAKAITVHGSYDSTGVHVEGIAAYRKDLKVQKFFVTFPESSPSGMVHMAADEAVYVPAGREKYSGGWLLTGTTPISFDGAMPPNLEILNFGRFFLRTNEVDFDKVTRSATWFMYASTPNLQQLLSGVEPRRLAPVAVMFHMRITRPITGTLLVLLGLAVILRDQTRHVFISAGLCLAVCAIFYATMMGCKYLGDNDFVTPALAAWLPVLIFGPISIAYFDAMHT